MPRWRFWCDGLRMMAELASQVDGLVDILGDPDAPPDLVELEAHEARLAVVADGQKGWAWAADVLHYPDAVRAAEALGAGLSAWYDAAPPGTALAAALRPHAAEVRSMLVELERALDRAQADHDAREGPTVPIPSESDRRLAAWRRAFEAYDAAQHPGRRAGDGFRMAGGRYAVAAVQARWDAWRAAHEDALPPRAGGPSVQEMGHRSTDLGLALYVRIRREDCGPMSWREVWDIFAAAYPDRWAAQFFPPAEELVDEANIYHLFVLEDAPVGVNIAR